jgi:hypothetical protein
MRRLRDLPELKYTGCAMANRLGRSVSRAVLTGLLPDAPAVAGDPKGVFLQIDGHLHDRCLMAPRPDQ